MEPKKSAKETVAQGREVNRENENRFSEISERGEYRKQCLQVIRIRLAYLSLTALKHLESRNQPRTAGNASRKASTITSVTTRRM